nr:formimidoylglutamase [uncultured Flavobacterium sp.]
MSYFKNLIHSDLISILNSRSNEIKLGERIDYPKDNQSIEDFIKTTSATFLIFGIAEDYGIKANNGVVGAKSAWAEYVKCFVNIQNNTFLKGKSVAVLGNFEFDSVLNIDPNLDIKNVEHLQVLYDTVSLVDKEISYLISVLIKHKKVPIIIGGGHNNAYGNIKGLSLAKGKAVNVVNFDAHTDFRNIDGRHSGNGFSYAYHQGFLKKYFVFGAHENYLTKSILKNIEATNSNVLYNTYESIAVREEKDFKNELKFALEHIEKDSFGIEVDMDAIPNIAASAQTPSGFSLENARKFVHFFGSHKKAAYLHICEAAPSLASTENKGQIGKAITYLVTDFIKAKTNISEN